LTVAKAHPRIAIHARVQGDASIRKLDKLKLSILVLRQDHQDVQPKPFRIPLDVLSRRDFSVAHVAGSDEIPDHDGLDAKLAKVLVHCW
jgi:hypothetical protein